MLTWTYDPPLEIVLNEPLPEAMVDRAAFTARLPNPPNGDEADEAFFYRVQGTAVGYFNRCSHVAVPLDMGDRLFLEQGGLIMCRFHGALYELNSGAVCRPPARTGLTRVLCEERDGRLIVLGWKRVLEFRSRRG